VKSFKSVYKINCPTFKCWFSGYAIHQQISLVNKGH